jgi:hypothetical protein
MKIYDSILFDEAGQSIPLSEAELIDYLLQNLHQLRAERDLLQRQLAYNRLMLDPTLPILANQKNSDLNF